jgi:hypothetical protein
MICINASFHHEVIFMFLLTHSVFVVRQDQRSIYFIITCHHRLQQLVLGCCLLYPLDLFEHM